MFVGLYRKFHHNRQSQSAHSSSEEMLVSDTFSSVMKDDTDNDTTVGFDSGRKCSNSSLDTLGKEEETIWTSHHSCEKETSSTPMEEEKVNFHRPHYEKTMKENFLSYSAHTSTTGTTTDSISKNINKNSSVTSTIVTSSQKYVTCNDINKDFDP